MPEREPLEPLPPGSGHGPVAPTNHSVGTHRPLTAGEIRLTGGLLKAWQDRNALVTLPLAPERLVEAGNLQNFEVAQSGSALDYVGPPWMDSDIYKTVEAMAWQASIDSAEGFHDFLDESCALLATAQQPDGYLNSWGMTRDLGHWEELTHSHELYCSGHLLQAAVAFRRAAADERLFRVAMANAAHLVDTFLGVAGGLDGHPQVETALVELYRETGRADFLSLAAQFVEQRGYGQASGGSTEGRRYSQDDEPARQRRGLVGHAVRALYLEAGIVDVAVETGDLELLESSVHRWDDMVSGKTALTGGLGSRHSGEAFGDRYELPPDRAYNETCAAIAAIQWSWRLMLATGEARYSDLIERILFNALGASISAHGDEFFYVNPLQRRADHFEKDDPGVRRAWFTCACCPPNLMRLFASLHFYVASADQDTLYFHQFTGLHADVVLSEGRLVVEMTTDYPWSGNVRCTVIAAPERPVALAFRIPGWSQDAPILLNGRPARSDDVSGGFFRLNRSWDPGDTVELAMTVEPRITYPDPRIDALRGTVAIEAGPVVYCLEGVDLAIDQGIDSMSIATSSPLVRSKRELAGVGPTVLVSAKGSARSFRGPPGLPYQHVPHHGTTSEVDLLLLPYFQWDNRGRHSMRVWFPGD